MKTQNHDSNDDQNTGSTRKVKRFLRLPRHLDPSHTDGSIPVWVGGARLITQNEILSGKFAHIGLRLDANGVPRVPDAPFMPPADAGIFSRRNINGEDLPRKDLPMELRTIEWDGLAYGEHPMTFSREQMCYVRERHGGDEIEARYRVLDFHRESGRLVVLVGGVLTSPVVPSVQRFDKRLLYHWNLMHEQLGIARTFDHEPSDRDLMGVVFKDVDLFPPDQLRIRIMSLVSTRHTREDKQRSIAKIQFLQSKYPDIRLEAGRLGFNGYLLGHVSPSCVVAEHMEDGNAAYVFGGDYGQYVEMSRTELLRIKPRPFTRIVHDAGEAWKDELVQAIEARRLSGTN